MPAAVPMAVPYYPDTVGVTSGPVGEPMARIRTALAELASYQAWAGAASESAALLTVHYEATTSSGSRWALVEHESGPVFEPVGLGCSVVSGSDAVRLYAPIVDDGGFEEQDRAFVGFVNAVHVIAADLVPALHGVMANPSVSGVEIYRPDEDDRLVGEDWYEARFLVEWGLRG